MKRRITKNIKNRAVALAIVFLIGVTTLFSGCSLLSSGSVSDPQTAVQNAYGDTQFTISFSMDTLSEPLEDITYTAYRMPTLPTPEKVGYIFEGWYMEATYVTPYFDGILYLYMCNVTLYAKWSKEEFAANGTYDIEFEAGIVESSVNEGEWTAAFGGYADFSEAIVAEETYIEKTDGGLRLRLQYDCGTTVPYGYSDAYQVAVSALSRAGVYADGGIFSDTETVKTVYLNIDGFDISDTLYLNITWTNWAADGFENNSYRAKTTTTYTVAFRITRLIGFTHPFEDTSAPLDDGYYLVQTHYKYVSGGSDSMAESYNPVYSYLVVSGGEYTLIKQFSPYAGFVGNSGSASSLADYFERAMTFIPIQLYYTLGETDFSQSVGSDYLPETYGAGYYGDYAVEFHADTGRFYSIYDLGDTLDQSLMIAGSVTGAMEALGAAGLTNIVMTIDTDSIIKLTSIDYEELSGDSYGYGDTFEYYAGNLSDLNERNMTKTAAEEYGLSSTLVNFFYSESGTMYSSRISVSATASTNAYTVADSRYRIAEFNVNAQIYGYNPQSGGDLYADCYTIGTYSGGLGIRQWNKIVQGRSCSYGEALSVQDIYDEFVQGGYTVTSAYVSYTAYRLASDGSVDYSNAVAVGSTIKFTQDVALVFVTKYSAGNATSVVYLTEESDEPQITVPDTETDTLTDSFSREEQYVYVSSQTYVTGDSVVIPAVSYVWGETQYSFIGDWYGNEQDGIDPTRVVRYTYENGAWSLSYLSRDSMTFTMNSETEYLAYELKNEYGEYIFLYIRFTSESAASYEISSSLEGVLASGAITYDNNGIRRGRSAERSFLLSSPDEIEDYYNNVTYTVSFSTGETYTMSLTTCILYYPTGYTEYTASDFSSSPTPTFSALEAQMKQYEYCYIYFVYSNTLNGISDAVTVRFLYNVSVNGKRTSDVMSYTDYFTDYTYTFLAPEVYSSTGVAFASATVSLRAYSGDTLLTATQSRSRYTLTGDGLQYTLSFKYSGSYRISYTIELLRDENGDRIFSSLTSKVSFTFYQYITVYDGMGNITITYVTDADHPFSSSVPYSEYSDDMMEHGYSYTVTYSLAESVYLLSKSSAFASGGDQLFGWVTDTKFGVSTSSYVYSAGEYIADYIGEFNTKNLILYAVWDDGLTVTAVVKYDDGTQDTVLKVTYTLNSNGYYKVSVADFSVIPEAPEGYVFVGWTGGFIGSDVVTSQSYNISASTAASASSSYFTIIAVFRLKITVSFKIDFKYVKEGEDFRKSITNVVDGSVLSSADIDDRNLTGYEKDGYTFVGWAYMDADGNYIMVDLQNDAIERGMITDGGSELKLYAVFKDEAGNYYYSND